MMPTDFLENQPLDAETSKKLQASIDEIKKEYVSDESCDRSKTVGLAALYLENDQNASAFKALQDLINAGDKSAATYYYLGEVYENAGQNNKARENYEITIQLASEMIVIAKAGLARIEKDEHKASNLCLEARAAFEALQSKTVDGFSAVRNEEQQRIILRLLEQLIPTGENRLFLLLKQITSDCPNCGTRKVVSPDGCFRCAPQ
jgi:tetratricopeptide (TPR) repeat protein